MVYSTSFSESKKKGTPKWIKITGTIFCILIAMIFCALIYFNITHEYHPVEGSSMSPTLNANDTEDGIFLSKVKNYSRGDIIVCDSISGETQVIKRLIAIGGDKLAVRFLPYGEIMAYQFVIIENGSKEEKVIEEDYIKDISINEILYRKFYSSGDNKELFEDTDFILIPKDCIFYVGDNRRTSNDCTNYGYRNKDCVIGKVDYIIFGGNNLYFQVLEQFFGVKKWL